jgi:hypothetical protein
MKQNPLWVLSGCALALICLGSIAEAPQKATANDEQKIASVPDTKSLKQYIDAHRGL